MREAGGAQLGPGAEDVQPSRRPGAPAGLAAPPLEGRPPGTGGPGALRAQGTGLAAPDPASLTYSLQPRPCLLWLPLVPEPLPPPWSLSLSAPCLVLAQGDA